MPFSKPERRSSSGIASSLVASLIAVAAAEAKKDLRNEIRADILNLALKILVGIILTFLMIRALGAIGEKLDLLLLAQENGTLLSIIGLVVVTVVCGIILAISLRASIQKKKPDSAAAEIQTIVSSFAQGLIDGFNRRSGPAPRRSHPERARLH